MPLKTRSGRAGSQRPDEISAFVEVLQKAEVRSYLEIGAREGDTFFHVMRSLPKGSKGVAVDMPGGKWGKGGTDASLRAAVEELRRQGYRASLVIGDSRALGTRQNVMIEGPYDAVFIDGDHTYEGVKADWQAYGRMGRIVAFHDIDGEGISNRQGHAVEVPRLWAEIKASGAECREIIGRKRGMGIGVVFR